MLCNLNGNHMYMCVYGVCVCMFLFGPVPDRVYSLIDYSLYLSPLPGTYVRLVFQTMFWRLELRG